jgi:hypothetical protein
MKDEVRQALSELDETLESMAKYPEMFRPSDILRRYRDTIQKIRSIVSK